MDDVKFKIITLVDGFSIIPLITIEKFPRLLRVLAFQDQKENFWLRIGEKSSPPFEGRVEPFAIFKNMHVIIAKVKHFMATQQNT